MEVHSVGRKKKKKKKKKKTERDSCTESKKKRAYLSLFCVCVFVCVFKVTLCITLVIKVSLIRYMLSTNREKRLKFIQKERKDLLFLGFFEGPEKNAIFFSCLVEKKQNHMY